MRLGISWVPDNLRTYPELARATEEAGFELLGVPDTQASVYRESYVTLATAALHSTRLRIGPLVTNPITRHPAVTAAALASLHELVPGRVIAAFGTGDSGVYNLGLRPARLETLVAYIKAVRAMLHGQPAEWRGATARVLWPQGGVPLFVGAGGPRTLELAGELADGVIIAVGATPEAIAAAEAAIARGAARAGRDPRSIERWWWVRGSLADSYEEAVTWSLPSLASVCNHAFRFSFEGKAVPERYHESIRQLQARYDFTAHNRFGADSPNGLLARELGLVDILVDRFGVVGTPRQVVERLRELEARGVAGIVLRI
ncbi:MAG: LLM class flavin-dependent oxidoreductase, partial [Chloroflexi bacterium]|nr:LLM class flavin-dependent oxidoreductase [Chloroflexota bacterium]